MSSSRPGRPWDNKAICQNSTPLLHSHLPAGYSGANSMSTGGGKPRLPPKENTQTGFSRLQRNNFQGYTSPLNSYGYGGIGSGYMPQSYGYGGYGNYGSYGNNYGMYGNRIGAYGNSLGGQDIDRSGFIEDAEESSREAFDSIASIVRAFSSVTMMLESTFEAVYSSFNAVLSVADHFSQLRSHFGQIFSILTMIRTLKWIHRKLFYLLGLRKVDPSTESAWVEAKQSSVQSNEISHAPRSSWPILVLLSALYVAPFLIWKCMSSLMKRTSTLSDWMTTENETDTVGVCIFDYQAQCSNELTVSCGEIIKLAPKHLQKDPNWPLVCLGGKKGLVPINYFNIRQRGQTQGSYNHQRSNPTHPVFNIDPTNVKTNAQIHMPINSSRRKDILLSHQRGPVQEIAKQRDRLPSSLDDSSKFSKPGHGITSHEQAVESSSNAKKFDACSDELSAALHETEVNNKVENHNKADSVSLNISSKGSNDNTAELPHYPKNSADKCADVFVDIHDVGQQ